MKLRTILCLFLYLVSSYIQADDCQKFTADNIIRVGSGNYLEPFHYLEAGVPSGLDIDIVAVVLNKANYCFNYTVTPSSARSMIELKQGRIDMLWSASFTEDRAEIAYYSIPYRQENIVLFWFPEKHPIILQQANLQELLNAGLRGVINLGGYYGEEVKQVLKEPRANLLQVSTLERRMKMLLNNRVDFVIEDELAGHFYLLKNKLSSIKVHPHVLHQNMVSFIFSKKSTSKQKVDRINKAIAASEDEITKIISRFSF
ncbi:MAG: amino acid ABC transporter substrate-binding protein [Gammaproteobacteria bacterium]|nr:MAG: amino acid ABC transporter substrate-binding protein [Gammaproteobacteria bacterium]